MPGTQAFDSGKTLGDNEVYRKLKTIGKGAFGKVYVCRRKGGGKAVVKRVEVAKGDKSVRREVAVMREVRHEHIVRLYDVWQSSNAVYIAMELAGGGDLARLIDYYKKGDLVISEANLRKIARQATAALAYLHSRCILHRDVKAANVFLTTDGTVKLGDFGLSTILAPSSMALTRVGTPYYMSPELVLGTEYSSSSDMWAFGVLLYELMHFCHPFEADTLPELHRAILTCDLDLHAPQLRSPHPGVKCSELLIRLTKRCLCLDPLWRITAEEVHSTLVNAPPPPSRKHPETKGAPREKLLSALEAEEAAARAPIESDGLSLHSQWTALCAAHCRLANRRQHTPGAQPILK